MPEPVLPLRHLLIEWRYAPQLGIYSRMDEVGLFFASEFPDWQRSALTLEIRNREKHQRIHIAFDRMFFEAADPDVQNFADIIELSGRVFRSIAERAKIESVKRVGCRQWFAFQSEDTHRDLVERCRRKFQPTGGVMDSVLPGTYDDMSFIIQMRMPADWKYRILLGPMERKEWQQFTPQEEGLFKDGQEGVRAYQHTVPDRFLFLDVDSSRLNVNIAESSIWLRTMQVDIHSAIQSVYRYFSAKD